MSRYNNPYEQNDNESFYDISSRSYNNPYKQEQEESGISWFWVILALFAVPPIGFFLIFLKIAEALSRNSAAKRTAKAKKQRKPRSLPKLLRTGSVALFIIGALMLFGSLGSAAGFNLYAFVQAIACMLGGGVLQYLAKKRDREQSRRQQYLAIVGNKAYIGLGELASIMGCSEETCRRELGKIIGEQGFGSTAYIDMSRNMLVINAALLPEKQPAPQSEAKPGGSSDYQDILREIRQLNDDIEDEHISERIETIENITAKIFEIVGKSPEKLPQIRSFLNYYLPTTLKLLHAYAKLEDEWQGGGSNMATAKRDIENIMDTLTECYKLQLDKLYADEKLDISSDIRVLESMMAREGIGQNDMLRPKGAH